ncbi:MAG: succinylglutamate-semialdehyde dehydrogenase [Verrucomicrobia bacterium]|nr:succinylglutamate-semialdehyde dehydrogenase [Verrucomicrobiota bacterium]MBV8485508.1 succinylglutamate-semialdehyde dehydrogenase [Verrucomicrobiota bacterium]
MLDHFIGGQWIRGRGQPFSSTNPATGEQVFPSRNADSLEVVAAFQSAKGAFQKWAENPAEERFQVARKFASIVDQRREEFVTAISRETGKPLWESNQEVDTVIKKVDLSISAYAQRTGYHEQEMGQARSVLSHAPHGIVAILGPFNFPAHLPNGHIVPALIAGNCAVFKPSELAPLTGNLLADCWREAGLPGGCLNLLQGSRSTAELILERPEVAGVFFTGSATTGVAIHQRFATRPEVILALEMGGNNPMVVVETNDAVAAARIVAVSAFISAGQRCTCTRRLIVVGNEILPELIRITESIEVGAPNDLPEPLLGPVITSSAASKVLKAQKELVANGAKILVECRPAKKGIPFLKPGILDVTGVDNLPDEEVFGPLLQVTRISDFDAAVTEANRTRFGLAAGLIGGTEKDFEVFRRRVRAGIINWNRPTTGASSAAPFGGVGLSGNHRPSAFYAADYCAYPVATLQSAEVSPVEYPGLGSQK